jgi:ubiquinone biosynthesis protein UbiJ
MIARTATAGLNHVLAQQPWARQRLAPFAGETVLVRCPPFPDLSFRIVEGGTLAGAAPGSAPALTVTLRPSILPLVLLRDETALQEISIQGSAGLAETVQFLFRNLSWDVEEDLSKVFGDVVAHRFAATGEAFLGWQRETALRLGENLAEYWKEEQPLLARPADVAAFGRDVAALRDDVAHLEKRLEALQRALETAR